LLDRETGYLLRVTAQVRTDDEGTRVTFFPAGMPDQTVTDIGEKLVGWQYQLPDYKKNLLTRRRDDTLKSADAESYGMPVSIIHTGSCCSACVRLPVQRALERFGM